MQEGGIRRVGDTSVATTQLEIGLASQSWLFL